MVPKNLMSLLCSTLNQKLRNYVHFLHIYACKFIIVEIMYLNTRLYETLSQKNLFYRQVIWDPEY